MSLVKLACFTMLLLTFVDVSAAETPEQKGYAVAKRAEDLTDAYTDYSAAGVMTLKTTNNGGPERSKKSRLFASTFRLRIPGAAAATATKTSHLNRTIPVA